MTRHAFLYARIAFGIAVVSFGAILVRLAQEAPSLAISAWRLTIAAAIVVPWALARRRSAAALSSRDVAWSIASGTALATHFLLWITSLEYTSVASSVLLVTTHPVFVALGSRFLLKERMSRRILLGIVLAIAGGVLVGAADFRFHGKALIGDALALGGGLAAAVYFLIGRRVRRTTSTSDYIAITYGTAAAVTLAACLAAGVPLLGFSPSTTGYLVLLAIGPQVIGHSTFNWALKHVPASSLSVLILGEPIGSTLLAVLFFGECPSALNAVGAAVILAGIYVSISKREAKHGRSTDRP